MAAVNPFGGATQAAPAPAEEAQQQTPTDPWSPPTVNTAPPAVVSSEGKIVMTFKEGEGFSATWNVVHADSVADAKAILADPEFKELLQWQKDAATFFRGGAAPSGGGNRGGGSQRQSAPAGAAQPPAGAPAAPGPDWVYKTGIAKSGRNAGKQWHAWMPPQHLKDSEDPLWFDL
jgi:hypothetical protein